MFTHNLNGWVNHAVFSPDSSNVCFITHDCEINFADVSHVAKEEKAKINPDKIMHNGNPHLTCMFFGNDRLIACGFDRVPYVYKKEGDSWKLSKNLDEGFTKVR